jgi:hypothetical protein
MGGVSPQDIGEAEAIKTKKVPRFVIAESLTVRAQPKTSAKKLGSVKLGDFVPDAEWVGVSDEPSFLWAYSKTLGGYVAWGQKVNGKWKLYLSSISPMSKQSFGLDPKQFALLMQTDWKNFKPATPKKPKPTTPAPATATPAPAPEKEEEAAAEDDEGMSTTAMLAIGAAVLAGGFFLLRRK